MTATEEAAEQILPGHMERLRDWIGVGDSKPQITNDVKILDFNERECDPENLPAS